MKKAFTVIEVIVTFVILSILIFFAIYTFRYSIANVQRALYYQPKKIVAFSLLDRVISGIYFYEIEKEPKHLVEYFQADKHIIKCISVAPPYDTHISIIQIIYIRNKLILRYEPLYNKKTNYESPKFTNHYKQIILFNQVTNLNFSYITREQKILSHLTDEIPQGIVLKMTTKGKKYQLIFNVPSNFYDNKVNVYNEKFQL